MKIQASLKVIVKAGNIEKSYDYVNCAIKMIKDSNLKYFVSPSETSVEGDYEEIFNLFNQIHNYLVNENLSQITMIITTDFNNKDMYIDEKLKNTQKIN